MTISAENLRRELLPGVDASTAAHLEESIREFISSRELPLYRMMSFQLGWVDENGERSHIPTRPRVHGQFALSVANAISPDGENSAKKVIPYAVSIELLHNFSLIHEDVEDGNTEHNGRPSVWWTWGPAQAINAGDGMHAMARMALFAIADRGESVENISDALRTLDQATVMMCEGEYTDIMMQEQLGLSVQKYIDMVRARSGALFGASAHIAALASGRPELASTLFKFGQIAGTARQLAADHMLFWGGDKLDPVQHGRLLTKKKNLPVAHAIETAPPSLKRQLGDIYVQRVIDPAKAGEITELLEQAGSRDASARAVENMVNEAESALDGPDLGDTVKERLSGLARALTGFDHSDSSPDPTQTPAQDPARNGR